MFFRFIIFIKNVTSISKYRQMYSIWICTLWFDENMRTPRWFSAIYPIKISYTHVWKSDLDQVDPNLSSRHVLVAFCLWKEMAHMTFATIIANFFTLIFFRFNMFIWRSIMFYVNAVLIKISVLNSTMTTASTSKFLFHFVYLKSQPDIGEHQT